MCDRIVRATAIIYFRIPFIHNGYLVNQFACASTVKSHTAIENGKKQITVCKRTKQNIWYPWNADRERETAMCTYTE